MTAHSQTYTLPSILFDSLTFEVYQGRACGELVKFQANEIQKGLNVEIKLRNELSTANQLAATNAQAASFAKAGEKEWENKSGIQEDIAGHYKAENGKLKIGLGLAILVIIGQIVFCGP